MQKFTEEMQYAQPRGPHAQWPEISDALSLAVNESITGTSTSPLTPLLSAEHHRRYFGGVI